MSPADTPSSDPVLERREKIRRLTKQGQRVGYLLFLIAVVVFALGFIVGFTDGLVGVITAAIVVGSIVLAPSIVLSYAVKAADQEDQELG